MGRIGDFLFPSDLPYPPGPNPDEPSCGDAPVPPPDHNNFLNRVLAPKELPYPLPPCDTGSSIRVNVPNAARFARAAQVTDAGGAVAAPPVTTGTPPAHRLLRAWAYSPEFPGAGDGGPTTIEEVLQSPLSSVMVTRDGAPATFIVPDGTDSLDLAFGPVEFNPAVATDSTTSNQVVTVGPARLSSNSGSVDTPLTPGTQIQVIVPWRAAGWATVPANTLRVMVYAHFFNSANGGL